MLRLLCVLSEWSVIDHSCRLWLSIIFFLISNLTEPSSQPSFFHMYVRPFPYFPLACFVVFRMKFCRARFKAAATCAGVYELVQARGLARIFLSLFHSPLCAYFNSTVFTR